MYKQQRKRLRSLEAILEGHLGCLYSRGSRRGFFDQSCFYSKEMEKPETAKLPATGPCTPQLESGRSALKSVSPLLAKMRGKLHSQSSFRRVASVHPECFPSDAQTVYRQARISSFEFVCAYVCQGSQWTSVHQREVPRAQTKAVALGLERRWRQLGIFQVEKKVLRFGKGLLGVSPSPLTLRWSAEWTLPSTSPSESRGGAR